MKLNVIRWFSLMTLAACNIFLVWQHDHDMRTMRDLSAQWAVVEKNSRKISADADVIAAQRMSS